MPTPNHALALTPLAREGLHLVAHSAYRRPRRTAGLGAACGFVLGASTTWLGLALMRAATGSGSPQC